MKPTPTTSHESTTVVRKRIYSFGNGEAEGSADLKKLLGGKGSGLAEMTKLGIPVPPGFTITTETCDEWSRSGRKTPAALKPELDAALVRLEKTSGKTFGRGDRPLLVSVRSGAAVSMPGMMETVLNLGLNDGVAAALEKLTGNRRFVQDAYRRFVQMFSNVVENIPDDAFEAAIEKKKHARGVKEDDELQADDLHALVIEFKAIHDAATGRRFPEDPREQLDMAIEAVFASYFGAKAVAYRELEKIEGLLGTAVTVQSMVFGNTGPRSGTGVSFTRDPSTGEDRLYGEWLPNAQGEDVVSGVRTPRQISEMKSAEPGVYAELERVKQVLERRFRDMQDIEFTWEDGKLYLLQTRNGKRTAAAAVRIAAEMRRAGTIEAKDVVSRVDAPKLAQLLAPVLNETAKEEAIKAGRFLAKGLPATPGGASGAAVFDAATAEARAAKGEKVILVRRMTSPEDIRGMAAANGILTSIGGMTSHAAVVARGMGKCCVVGCQELRIDYDKRQMSAGDRVVKEGEPITLDGFTGEVIVGSIPSKPSAIVEVIAQAKRGPINGEAQALDDYRDVLGAADSVRRLRVRANADTPEDARVARRLGAEGIGLCRTEHMFFAEDRILSMRHMILSRTRDERRDALAKLLPFQRDDFKGIFRAMDGLPVTIRLLDPPLHEFLPHTDELIKTVAEELELDPHEVAERVRDHHEVNPMLGHRGCRLGISYPEIYEMQAQAIAEAACDISREGFTVHPEIMVPFIGTERELEILRKLIVDTIERVFQDRGVRFPVPVGTMIEIPRAALIADRIARTADFFSFGTNDLTQMTFGISRDDAEKEFLPDYVGQGIFRENPFAVLDRDGVGALIEIAAERGRRTRQGLKLGICGEHGGEPSSIAFCHKVGLDYVSCSPYRVPIARLAAARAAIE